MMRPMRRRNISAKRSGWVRMLIARNTMISCRREETVEEGGTEGEGEKREREEREERGGEEHVREGG